MKRLLVAFLLPWWLLLLLLPFILAVWAVIGAFYLCAGIVALAVVVTRTLAEHHRARTIPKTVPTPAVAPAGDAAPQLPRQPAVAPSAELPPVTRAVLPDEQRRQIAYDLLQTEVASDRFALVIHDLFSALGFSDVTVVPGRPILTMSDLSMEPVVVRCIPFTAGAEVDAMTLTESVGLRTEFATTRLEVVSMTPFTPAAEQFAVRDRISLFGPNRILDLMAKAGWLQGSEAS
jgi:hypothetical protein